MRRPFTLLELVVVIAVIALSTGLAVTTFRGETPARAMDNFSLNLDSYFARVRFRATEDGATWEVYLDAQEHTFTACRKMSAAEYEEYTEDNDAPPPVLKWTYPEKFLIDAVEIGDEEGVEIVEKKLTPAEIRREDEEQANAEYRPAGVRLFYFYADGFVGGCGNRLKIELEPLTKLYEVSPLTGRLLEVKDEEQLQQEAAR